MTRKKVEKKYVSIFMNSFEIATSKSFKTSFKYAFHRMTALQL